MFVRRVPYPADWRTRDWLTLDKAAPILKAHGLDPRKAIAQIIRETGLGGFGLAWMFPSGSPIRGTALTALLHHPRIDMTDGTIMLPTREPGRRTPLDVATPLLVSREEIDRRWLAKHTAPAVAKFANRPPEAREAVIDTLSTLYRDRGFETVKTQSLLVEVNEHLRKTGRPTVSLDTLRRAKAAILKDAEG